MDALLALVAAGFHEMHLRADGVGEDAEAGSA
jgi:hypothetical protein